MSGSDSLKASSILDEPDDWEDFISCIWPFQWLLNHVPFAQGLSDLMFYHSQGIIDIAIKLFASVQWLCILDESEQLSLYFLIDEREDGSGNQVYIGQCGDMRKRLLTHNNEKDFWQRAVVITTKTESLTSTHVLFLENQFIQEAGKSGRYVTENCNEGTRSHTPLPLAADRMEIFESARTLVTSLGYPIFEPVAKASSSESQDNILYCKRSGSLARGCYTDEGFVVFKGSIGKAEIGRGFPGHSFSRLREDLLQQGKIALRDGSLAFNEDVLFTSPSGASAAVCGTACNGWLDWKNADGVTLHDLTRPTV